MNGSIDSLLKEKKNTFISHSILSLLRFTLFVFSKATHFLTDRQSYSIYYTTVFL